MKRDLLVVFGLFFCMLMVNGQTITYTTATTPVTCFGGNDGSATITSINGTFPFNSSTKGLLISEVLSDPTGTDSPFEFVELVATRVIDFSSTPYTVIFCNNNTATANGWINGGTRTYAFSITTGIVFPGEVVYVGGSSMIPLTNQLRAINTATTPGDGGIGNAAAGGVLGNGGASCDGIAVFNIPVASITSSSVPIDAIFFGNTVGAAYVSSVAGYELPVNDVYSGGKLDTISFLAPQTSSGNFLKATFGVYNTNTNTFTYPRTWATTPTFTDTTTSILLDGIYNVNWSNACTSVYNPNLIAGNYTFTISDALSNIVGGNVNVTDGTNISLNASASDPLACAGDVIDLSAQNADTYVWSTGDSVANPQVTVTVDTLLIVMGTDTTLGCTYVDSVFIDVNPYPTVNFTLASDTVCNNGGSISLNATPTGGVFSGAGVTGSTLDPSSLTGSNNVLYTYTDSNGCSDNEIVNYFVLNCLGLEGDEELNVGIYPNPATDFIYINSHETLLQYILTDVQGKLISQGPLNAEKNIYIHELNNGVYILSIYNHASVKKVKIMKN